MPSLPLQATTLLKIKWLTEKLAIFYVLQSYNISTFFSISCITSNPKQNIIPSMPLTCIPTNIATIVSSGLIPTLADTNLGSNICLSIDNPINTIAIPMETK